MNKPKLLVFDWDGTLCDSLSRIVESLQLAAAEVSLPVPPQPNCLEIIGLGLREALEQLFPGIDEAGRERLKSAYADIYISLDQQPSPFYEGVREALDALKSRGYVLAVATGKARRGLDRVLDGHGLSRFFDATRCADESASKPDPLMLRQLMAELAVAPGETLMVGDTEFDMAMAVAADVKPVAVSYGAHSAERLHPYGLIACLDRFPDILTMLEMGGAERERG